MDAPRTPYGAPIMEHFRRPRNERRLPAPDLSREGTNPPCADRVRIELAVRGGRITEARFTANACAISVAAASVLTERVRGMATGAAGAITDDELCAELGEGIPAARRACAILPLATMRAALLAVERFDRPLD